MDDLIPVEAPKVHEINPEMIVELALGQEDPYAVAARYGLDAEAFVSLRANKHFRTAVARKLAELQKEGVTFKIKTAMMAEALIEELYKRAKDPEMSTSALLQIVQWLTRVGDLEPKTTGPQGPQNGFNVVINLPALQPEAKVIGEGST